MVVQVSGELSNNGQPMRRFMQTCVLAPQSPKKYYVHNDIFRYQDEVFGAAAAQQQQQQQQQLLQQEESSSSSNVDPDSSSVVPSSSNNNNGSSGSRAEDSTGSIRLVH